MGKEERAGVNCTLEESPAKYAESLARSVEQDNLTRFLHGITEGIRSSLGDHLGILIRLPVLPKTAA